MCCGGSLHMCTPCWGVITCTLLRPVLLAKCYWSRFVFCDVARSDWPTSCTLWSGKIWLDKWEYLLPLYKKYKLVVLAVHLWWFSSVPINFDNRNHVIVKSVIMKSQPTIATSICYNICHIYWLEWYLTMNVLLSNSYDDCLSIYHNTNQHILHILGL